MPDTFRRNLAGVSALLTIIWASVLWHVGDKYPLDHNFHHAIDSPVLALEMSETPGEIDAVLHRPTAAEAIANQGRVNELDLVFIPLYTLSIWSFGRLFTAKARLLAAIVIGAGLSDYIEDWKIFDALRGGNPPIFIPALIKWGLIGLACAGVAVILFGSNSELYSLSTKRIMGIGYMVAAILLLIDVALGRIVGYAFIALANSILGLLILSNVIGLLGHYVALPGIRQKYIEDFCERRKELQARSITAIKGEQLK